MPIKTVFLVCLLFQCFSCNNTSKREREIADIDVRIDVERFDILFSEATPKTLSKLMSDYPFMFSRTIADSVWIRRIKDTLRQQLSQEIQNVHKNFQPIESEINMFFKHLQYYYPTFNEPRVITFSDLIDYRTKVFVTDSITLIALDTYLGKDHQFYGNIQKYLRQNFEASQIVSDLAFAYAEQRIYQAPRKSLVDEMIYFGKILYFKDVMIPFKTDEEKIGYTEDELSWARQNEKSMWEFFIEREMLYDTNAQLTGRFINAAPFTKFNLQFDSESPGRLGQYVGWQIVRSFMKNNDIKLNKMLQMDALEIFSKSRYKPRK